MSFGGSTGFDELRLERSESEEEHDGGLMTHPEAQAAAEARYREVAITRYKLTLKIVGDAQIPAKCVVAVHGIANTVDGVYYVQAVENGNNGSAGFGGSGTMALAWDGQF